MERAQQATGQLIYRNEDLDSLRCKLRYSESAVEDLRWFGIDWEDITSVFWAVVLSLAFRTYLVQTYGHHGAASY